MTTTTTPARHYSRISLELSHTWPGEMYLRFEPGPGPAVMVGVKPADLDVLRSLLDTRWTALRDHITQERAAQSGTGDGHAELGHRDESERCYGRVEALDGLLATMDRMEAGQ